MSRIPAGLRKRILARDAGRCAFCRCPESLMGVTFEVDHIIPRAAGGKTTQGNLCLCCPTCNRHKAARLRAPDPRDGEAIPLFHPIRDTWEEHFEWREEATILAGRTAVGRTNARAVLTALRVRGIVVSCADRDRILAEKDPARLERWLERAILAASVAEVIDESRAA